MLDPFARPFSGWSRAWTLSGGSSPGELCRRGSCLASCLVAAAASVLAAILVVTVGASSEVSLVAPPPPTTVEEERETELPATPSGGLHGSPSQLETKALEGDIFRMELEHPSVARET